MSITLDLKRKLYPSLLPTQSNNWQSQSITQPMVETTHIYEVISCPASYRKAVKEFEPDQPWADVHFAERIGEKPLNPGESYKIWPYYNKDEIWRGYGKFSHTYMERMWPENYKNGNLNDVIYLLDEDMYTRQAYLPIWWPEDTGNRTGVRVPCSLGYHFMFRDNAMSMSYHIRSIDIVRHLNNDLYFAARLLQHVCSEVDFDAMPGKIYFIADSVHCFESDLYTLNKQINV